MFTVKTVFYLCAIYCVYFVNCNDTVTEDYLVRGPNGLIRGEKRQNYIAFEGMPYAQPPIGENRFENPKPLKTQWDGIKNATKYGETCMQWDNGVFLDDKLHGSEDCLFINIYTPNHKAEKKYPVIFYIHGGGFMNGNADFYGPDYILQQPLVYVNFNYRVGPLGFLSTEDENIPGNMGLKDQNLALKWVNENIEKFGGDTNKITILGHSAGGASVHLHYLSPLSIGLFANGISHSASALNPFVITENAGEKARLLANHLGCPTNSISAMVKCLKQKPAEDIVRGVKLFQPWLYIPFTPFGPVIEPLSDQAFLCESPLHLLEQGKYQQLPWLISGVESEGLYPAAEMLRDPKSLPELDSRWHELAPLLLVFNGTVPLDKQNEVSDSIREHFFKDNPISRDTFSSLVKMLTDRLFLNGINYATKLQAITSKAPVYSYLYKFPATVGLAQLFSNEFSTYFDSAHGDDIILIFSNPLRMGMYTPDELLLQNFFVKMYYDYANSGNLAFANIPIEPMEKGSNNIKFLEIVNPSKIFMNSSPIQDSFWKNIPYYKIEKKMN